MKTEPERLIESLTHQYMVRPNFLTEVRPLVDKIFAEDFPERDREGLLRLVEDSFRREAESVAAFNAGIAALEQLHTGMRRHAEALESLGRRVRILSRFFRNLRRISLN